MVPKPVDLHNVDSTAGPSNTGRKTPSELPQSHSLYEPYPVGSVWGTCSLDGTRSREVVILSVRRYSARSSENDLLIAFRYLPTPYFPSDEVAILNCNSFSKRFLFEREVL